MSLKENWESYKEKVVPKNASKTQLVETEQAFYSGAYAACLVMISISSEEVDEESGVKIFDDMIKEAEAFILSKIVKITNRH